MIDIILTGKENGYDVIGQYIRRYWKHNTINTVIVSFETSYDGVIYEQHKELACPINLDDIEFFYDWWEGERFIRLYGIQDIDELNISGGIYIED